MQPRIGKTKRADASCRALWIPEMMVINVKSYHFPHGSKDTSTLMIRKRSDADEMEIMFMNLAEITFLCPMR